MPEYSPSLGLHVIMAKCICPLSNVRHSHLIKPIAKVLVLLLVRKQLHSVSFPCGWQLDIIVPLRFALPSATGQNHAPFFAGTGFREGTQSPFFWGRCCFHSKQIHTRCLNSFIFVVLHRTDSSTYYSSVIIVPAYLFVDVLYIC